MKNPILVILLIFDERFKGYHQSFLQFPIKKDGENLIIDRQRFLQFIFKKLQLTEIEQEQLTIEYFYDRTKSKFIQTSYYVVNNCFQFPQHFFGDPMILEMKIDFPIQYWDIVHLYEDVKHQENIIQKYRNEQGQLDEKLNKYPHKLKEIENDVRDLKNGNLNNKQLVDIGILYNSTLIQFDNEIQEAQFIDYQSEISTIENEIKNADKKINYVILNATKDNFDQVLRLNPQVIHLILNGDVDVENQSSFIEIQDDENRIETISNSDFFDIFKYHKRNLKRLKLICLSSIIAKNVLFDKWEDQKTIVGQIKLSNSEDKYGNDFWKSFYKQLIQGVSFKDSYDNAKKNAEELFKKDPKPNDFTICCCYHEHQKKQDDSPNTLDCPNNPMLYGYKKCHKEHKQCICNHSNDNGNYNHDFSQKFFIKSCNGGQLLEINKDPNTNPEQTIQSIFLQINKQIIIFIYGKNHSPNKFELVHDKLLNYFKNYSEIKKLNPLNYKQLEITEKFDDLNQNIDKFLDESDDKLKILKLIQIDKNCDKSQFSDFYDDLLYKFQSKQNLVIILEMSDQNHKYQYLENKKNKEFLQIFYYDIIEEALNNQRQQQ
ncbi:unnamed protein product [Paramecium primaurelia]|uniref:Uncharacterized protein n=1 Tax=Paramecium primaurelia TaxID=5886 RepID=A0A8S1LAL1_PARPR|nr:unnamed protein product [Paramecium primaurelia]